MRSARRGLQGRWHDVVSRLPARAIGRAAWRAGKRILDAVLGIDVEEIVRADGGYGS